MPSAFSMPPIRCSSPATPGRAQGRARVTGSRSNGRNTGSPSGRRRRSARSRSRPAGRAARATSGQPPRLGAVGQVAVGQQQHRRAVGGARSAPPPSRRRSSRRGARRDRPAPAPRRCGRTSPAAGRPARSWSAARSTGPPRWTSTTTSGSSSDTASPIVSLFSARPGPGRRGHPDRAAVGRAERRADRGDLVLGLDGRHAEPLEPAQRVQDVRRRRDRVRARAPAAARTPVRRRDQPVRQRDVAGDVAVRARPRPAPAPPRTSTANASVVSPNAQPALNAARFAASSCGRCAELLREEPLASPRSGGCTATTAARARTCSSPARPPCG